ncbi:hydroxyethylthiazole kinase [Arthrobacter sp. zg-Y40]|uniref:hydroxyethylthiazole kinase n=2 Tax=unclassified Arthrobacter TaxID=235627 RepID=UPI001D13321E|nr:MULTISPECIES: hydroxyethylthiazole kinase [unclassified Arthrobacter]MCC3278492.1 hydroxyethylthiazole kinase [Arthrobacter sp. zg-Y40]MDK1326428.1 hydroxyethylthiazole kinase [Arthrobacter sp. zg-Y1143]
MSRMTIRLTPLTVSDHLSRLRAEPPLVQCLTNAVVTNFTANVLLALGAAPAMTDIPGEAGPFARVASAVLINLGTPHADQRTAMLEAAEAANAAGTPWVLDPVAVGSLPVRTALAAELLALRPTAVRANASEIMALAGLGSGGRGVDATDNPEDALPAASLLAAKYGCIVAVSGATDVITDGTDTLRLSNGTSLLTKVTGGGCALGAVTAAFLAVAGDAGPDGGGLVAAAAATAAYTVAAEHAAVSASGPGSFAPIFLDTLWHLDAELVAERLAAA